MRTARVAVRVSLCMRGRMIYFDRRVYTQCVLITKISSRIVSRHSSPLNNRSSIYRGSDNFAIPPFHLTSRDRWGSFPGKNYSCEFLIIYSDYSFQIWLGAGNIRKLWLYVWAWYGENFVVWYEFFSSNRIIAMLSIAITFLFLNKVASTLVSFRVKFVFSYDLGK